jgi:hypothetical protein
MTDPIQNQSQSNPDSGASDPRVDTKSPILAEPRREESKQTQGGQQQQQRLDEGKIDGTGREKRESRNSEESEPAPATSKTKEASPAKAESKVARQEPAGGSEVKRTEGSSSSSELFTQKTAGDRLPAAPGVSDPKSKDQSQRYRDKYAEVMRDFQTGSLRGKGNHVVKEADEAKAIATEQALTCDSSQEHKDSQAH